MVAEDERENYEVFIDCLSSTVIARLAPAPKKNSKRRGAKGRKNEIKPILQDDGDAGSEKMEAGDLSDFVEYLASEIFPNLPLELRTLSYATTQNDPNLASKFTPPLDPDILQETLATLPPTVPDSLTTYTLIPNPSYLEKFLEPALTAYITTTTTAPPSHTPASKPEGCELCDRPHIPLTYHHLIPRQMHSKAVKRGWHAEWELNKVAWLCRACHSFVHRVAGNEELAREFYDVELLLGREDVQGFVRWVGRVRWKAR